MATAMIQTHCNVPSKAWYHRNATCSPSSSRSSGSSSNRSPGPHICLAVQQPRQSAYSTDSVTSDTYEEVQYEATKQSQQRRDWQVTVRSATGRQHHIVWSPSLNPPALLSQVTVVLVGPKKPISCGVVARACSCFECEDIRFVQPRCEHNTRSSCSVSKGAQYILHRAQVHQQLSAALADCDLSVAFTRWLPDLKNKSLPDVTSLLAHPVVQQMLQQPVQAVSGSSSSSVSSSSSGCQSTWPQQHDSSSSQHRDAQQQQQQLPVRIALVFGREEFGLSDDEVAACDVACAISIGRLQESLSLSHAVSIVLAQLYQARLSAVAASAAVPVTSLPYSVRSMEGLAEGVDSSSGTEH